ncbi:MAG TPA: Ig-like domain-containing protein [Bacteroidales bacterium]|nr:Ig-like domain-containing protein [Bacteroidales bacterium]
MNKQHLFLSMVFTLAVLLIVPSGCKKDENPAPPKISTLMADDMDLNGATPPTNVSTTPVIKATFNVAIDPATANSGSITMTQDYDNADIPLVVTVSGKEITITPQQELGMGALYKLNFSADVMSTDGLAVEAFSRSFTTMGTFAPSGAIAYWNFENNADDQVGNFNPMANGVIDITYAASHNDASGMAAQFNGNTSLIEIPNGDQLMNNGDFALSFWVMADSTQHGQFTMGLAGWNGFQFEIAGDYGSCKLAAQYAYADGTSGSEDLWFPGTGLTPDSWQGWTFQKDLTNSGGVKALLADKWANIVCVYNSATKVGTMYINGEKMKAQDFNLWPEGDIKTTVTGLKYAGNPGNNILAFGFIQAPVDPSITDAWADYNNPDNNHFKGMLDDVSVYHKVLTEKEIQLMYNSGKP